MNDLKAWLDGLKEGDEVALENLPVSAFSFQGLSRVVSRTDATIRISYFTHYGYAAATGLSREPGTSRRRIVPVTDEHRLEVEQRRRSALIGGLTRPVREHGDRITPEQFDQALATFRAALGQPTQPVAPQGDPELEHVFRGLLYCYNAVARPMDLLEGLAGDAAKELGTDPIALEKRLYKIVKAIP